MRIPDVITIVNELTKLLEPELVLWLPPDPDINPKDPPSISCRFWVLLTVTLLGCGDEELRADKYRAGDPARWKRDFRNYLGFGGDSDHLATTMHGNPETTLHVLNEAVRDTGAIAQVKEDPLVGDIATLDVEIKGVDVPRWRVRDVHGFLIIAPPDAVGDNHLL